MLFVFGGFLAGVGISLLLFVFARRPSPPPSPLTQEQIEEQNKQAWVTEKIASMSAQEKVGQMLMWHINEPVLSSQSAKLLTDIPFGGVIIMGTHSKESLKKLIDQINAIPAVVPRFIAIDEEGGTVKRLTDDTNPGAAALSNVSFPEFCDAYKKTTQLLKDAGVNMNFGIVADIGWFPDGFISPRTFGKNPRLVTDLVEQAATCSAGILTTAKHFPGHGRTRLDSHSIIPVIKTPYNEWATTDALPFQKAIDANVPVIMLGHLLYESIATQPASLSPFWVTKLRDMGYKGLTITDDLGMLEKGGVEMEEIVQKARESGTDVLLFVSSTQKPEIIFQSMYSTIQKAIVPQEDIDNKIRRILQYKYDLRKDSN